MATTLAQVLSDTRKLIQNKQAMHAASEIPGTPVNSIAGSEHDSKVPDEAKSPNKETRDGTMVPNSGLKVEGAGKKDITTEHVLEADQSAATPKEKPLDSDDANAKEASATADLANSILSLIRTEQKTAAAPTEIVKHVGEKAVESGKKLLDGAKAVAKHPAATHGAAAVGGGAVGAATMHHHDKKAELNMELTTEVMAKVAALILSTEEGAEMAERVLAKQAGAEMAQETLNFLAAQSAAAEKQAAFDAGQRDAQNLIDRQIFEAGVKQAQAQAQAQRFYKLGQAAADASMGDMMGAGAEGAAPGDPAAEGGEGGEEISMEDITSALEALVAEGHLKPEEAQEVMQYLTQGEGAEGDPAEGAPAEAAPAAAAPEAAVADESKQASAKQLLATIRELRAAK